MDPQLELIWKLGTSLAIGLLIGIERGWHGRTEDEGDRVAGIRTFSLSGLLGGIWAILIPYTGEWILGLVFIAFTGLIIASYVFEQKVPEEQDIGITTEVGLLLTFTLGSWAALGYQIEALATAVVVTTLLSIKPVLHSWLQKIDVEVIYAGIKLLIISVILLPLLPNQGYGPWNSLNPYWIWWMVVLISGLSFLGFILVKYAGEDKGTLLTSIIGGLASSTAVTLSLAQFAKQHHKGKPHIYVAGVLIASSIMLIRVFIEVSVVNPALLTPLWIPLAVMLVLTIGCVLWLWIKSEDESSKTNPTLDLGNPLQLPTALKFGALLAIILVLATALQEWFGDQGVYLLSLLSGLMDVDAITLSLSRMAQTEITAAVATLGIVIAVISNTLVKAGLFIFWVGWKRSLELLWMILIISTGGVLSVWLFV
ncbi:MAG: MgtC/SapB family protein [Gracilimonas sp.]|uniref:MgtC/SapB family protein n=1 Tax=Gracilimonas sp. TaxID=1974203 RepID=UPI0019B319B7|nr:MgtC/SapB family protein [Gracilimonas sp.]MBD3617076.1 MgtC/SapB family protein [Gracilimonas sp.]